MDEIYAEFPYYGYRRIYRALLNENYEVCEKETYRYMGILGIKAIYPKKKINTSIPDNGKKYPYLLKNLEITRPNQVWASDITYVRLNSGFAYLCAVIDIFTRSILSWRLSYTMDDNLTIPTLNDALLLYGKPEIFNSDQGSQYTAQKFINTLVDNHITISMDSKVIFFYASCKSMPFAVKEYGNRQYIYGEILADD
jgi:putative transposase